MLKIKDLKEGEYYQCIKEHTEYVFKYKKSKKFEKCEYFAFLSNYHTGWFNTNDWADCKGENLEIANDENKHWLNECIKANKFIPYEEAIKTFKPKSLVGRYVKTQEGEYLLLTKSNNNGGFYVNNSEMFIDLHYVNHPDRLKDNYKLMPEGWTPKQEQKFIKGKWYKNTQNKNYRKCSETGNILIYNGDRITDGYYYTDSGTCRWIDENIHLLTDLSEIQPYLPDNHPDKITKQENYEYEVVHCKTQEELKFAIKDYLI